MTLADEIKDSVHRAVSGPVDVAALTSAVRAAGDRRARRHVRPLAAAAAVVAVVGAATAVAVHVRAARSPAEDGGAMNVVPFAAASAAGDAFVPPPFRGGVGGGAAPKECVPGQLTATADLSVQGLAVTGVLRVRFVQAGDAQMTCQLPREDPKLVLLDASGAPLAAPSQFAGQPSVPNPPQTPLRAVDPAHDVLAPVAWQGPNCSVAAALRLVVGAVSVDAPLAGAPRPCTKTGPPGEGTLTVGIPRTDGEAAAVLPADRSLLAVTLSFPEDAVEGRPLRYLVSLHNPTAGPIPLRPCPEYMATFSRHDSDGSTTTVGAGGPTNCRALPGTIRPGGTVVLEMLQNDLASTQPGPKDADHLDVSWGIAGPANATGRVPLRR